MRDRFLERDVEYLKDVYDKTISKLLEEIDRLEKENDILDSKNVELKWKLNKLIESDE